MKRFLILVIILCLSLNIKAQMRTAGFRLKEAQRAYHEGKYLKALSSLEEAERLLGRVTQPILYLMIINQKALLPSMNDPEFYTKIDRFDDLEVLRQNCINYLKNYRKSENTDDKYKNIYQIQQSLKSYPVAKVQFDEMMHLRQAESNLP